MAQSYVVYSGNGVQTDYAIPFSYLDATHLAITVGGVAASYSFINSSAIRLTVAAPNGSVVRIERKTDRSGTPVDFVDGSNLLEQDLDRLSEWSLFVTQEIEDFTAESVEKQQIEFTEVLADASSFAAAAQSNASAAAASAASVAALAPVNLPTLMLGFLGNGTQAGARSSLGAVGNADLATSNDASKGAGQAGYSRSTAYAGFTVGAKLNKLEVPQDFGTALPGTSFAIGPGAGTNTVEIGNLAVGYNCLTNNVNGKFSTAVGGNNQRFAIGIGYNQTFGYGAGYNLINGYGNTVGGFEALHDCQNGNGNSVFGYGAQHYGLANGGARDTSNVVAIGLEAAQANRADAIVAVGTGTLKNNQGAGNTAVGSNAGNANVAGSQCVFVGDSAGASHTTGVFDVLIGYQAGYSQTNSLGYNVKIGGACGYYNTSSLQNVFVGYAAGQGASGYNGGGNNVALGNQAMEQCRAVSNVVAVGNTALRFVQGNGNTAVGDSALGNETTGINLTSVGNQSGSTQTVGLSNSTNLGFGANCTASNQVTLGNSSITAIRAQVTTITALSDRRDKTDITPLQLGLEFIKLIEPVEFTWAMREESARNGSREAGFIAQDLKAAQEVAGVEWLGLVTEVNPDRIEATPGKLLPILIKAVQELSAEVDALKAQLAYANS